MGGYNAKVWDNTCPFAETARCNWRGNVWASSWILSKYLGKSHGNILDAYTYYKGWSSLGRQQAKDVYEYF